MPIPLTTDPDIVFTINDYGTWAGAITATAPLGLSLNIIDNGAYYISNLKPLIVDWYEHGYNGNATISREYPNMATEYSDKIWGYVYTSPGDVLERFSVDVIIYPNSILPPNPPLVTTTTTTLGPTNPTAPPPEGCCGCLLIPYEIVNIEDVIFTLPGIALGEPLYLSTTLAPDIITLSINISTTTPTPTTYAPTTTINPTIPTTIIQKQCKCGEVGCNALKF